MNVTVADILKAIDQIAPFSTADDWDNSGLLVGDPNKIVNNVLLSLDVTEEVVNEAITGGYDLIISHHPLIFKGLKTLVSTTSPANSIIKLIKSDISIISAHTNLDLSFEYGINRYLADQYELKDLSRLNDEQGYGIIGEFSKEISVKVFLDKTKSIFNIQTIKCTNLNATEISRVALCSGASADFISDAIRNSVDAYITSDIKYHEAQSVIGTKVALFDVGHFESEFVYLHFLGETLSKCIKNVEFSVTTAEKPLFSYL
ncbi:MAG: Nif3-like dinuclear metal center hexameric protein [Clostridiales bacterium 38-18]|nr:MAG: Nif3-like dinuclear metal center hexameric protein [Clostridiales bacterium 38-18]